MPLSVQLPDRLPGHLFLDLDGVLGDFYRHCRECFGELFGVDQEDPTELFKLIREHGDFYATQPLMPDALELWHGVKHLYPTILSGVPHSVPNVHSQKRRWVDRYLGHDVPLICCHSRLKGVYGQPNDILVDDRLKYSQYWLEMGGIFLLHTSASATLQKLAVLAHTGPVKHLI